MVKKGFLLLIVLLYILPVMGQNESLGSLESFDFPSDDIFEVSPPPPPDTALEELQKFDVFFLLKDYNTKNIIGDIHVKIELYDRIKNTETKTIQYVGENGLLKLRLEPAPWDIILKVDELETAGKDYFFKSRYNIGQDMNRTIYLLPVGSVKGMIYDNSGSVVRNAKLKFECGAGYGETEEKVSDVYGSFTSYWLPLGSCRISAIYNNKVGYKEIEITKGGLETVDIVLNKVTIQDYSSLVFWFMIAVILLVYFYIWVQRKAAEEVKEEEKPETKKRTKKKKAPKKEKGELNPRARDVIETLKERERAVVSFLLDNKNKGTQANIKNSTRIPKTSLVRVFQSLESKNIITVEKIGKMKKIKLTDWFLGKE